MSQTYQCPSCRAQIALDDVNPAADLALCRSCGRTSSFSMIASATSVDPTHLAEPPKGLTIEPSLFQGTRLVYRRLSPALLFLIPFTAFWSGFSMWGIYIQPWREGTLDLTGSLAGLPFLLGTIVLLAIIFYLLVGRCVITLEGGLLSVFLGVGAVGWTRRFEYTRDSQVCLRLNPSVKVNNTPQQAVCVRTEGKEFLFGSTWKRPVKEYVAASISRGIAQMR